MGTASTGRLVKSVRSTRPRGPMIELFMSASNLGWMKVKTVTDRNVIRRCLGKLRADTSIPVLLSPTSGTATLDDSVVLAMHPGAVRSVDMWASPLHSRASHCFGGATARTATPRSP